MNDITWRRTGEGDQTVFACFLDDEIGLNYTLYVVRSDFLRVGVGRSGWRWAVFSTQSGFPDESFGPLAHDIEPTIDDAMEAALERFVDVVEDIHERFLKSIPDSMTCPSYKGRVTDMPT